MVNIRDLAEGFLKAAVKSEINKIKDKLINVGNASAVTLTCTLLKARLGIPLSACVPIATKIVSKISSEIRENITKRGK